MLKILLVDDERFAIEGLIMTLDWNKFQGELVGTAASAEEALALMETIRPDVVISDIKMASMDGIELSQKIKEKDKTIQVILLTAHGEFEYAQKALQYGVIDYILKPITREKILNLEEVLSLKQEQLLTQRRSYLTVWDADLEKKLIHSLKEKDLDTLDEFFQSAFFKELMSGDSGDLIGIQLINYLYLYLQDMNLEPKALNYSKNTTIENFLDLSGSREKSDFIIVKYYDLMTTISQQKHAHTDAIATYAFRYIETHYTDPNFNLSELSYAMHVSLSHLSTVFKQTTGNNLSTYVTELRIEKAKALLVDMQYSIADISTLSGYNDSGYFAKTFKKRTGNTPSEYRNLTIHGGIDEF